MTCLGFGDHHTRHDANPADTVEQPEQSQHDLLAIARLPCGVSLLVGMAACLVGLDAGAAESEPRRPNLVFILTDNQGAWTLGCYGNPDIRTPHIDRLAREGMRFMRARSSNPVCSPTRATFLTTARSRRPPPRERAAPVLHLRVKHAVVFV